MGVSRSHGSLASDHGLAPAALATGGYFHMATRNGAWATANTQRLCRLDEGPSSAGHPPALAFPDISTSMSGGGTMRHLIRLAAVIAAMATALLGAPAVLAN